MAVGLEFEGYSWRDRAGELWAAFARTAVGDVVATLVALTGVSLLFLAAAYTIIALARAAGALFRLVGG